jgi:hypothetical protein
MVLTEFEKTILLSLFIIAKGSTRKSIPLEMLLSKYPIRHRRMVKQYLGSLVGMKYLSKTGENYQIERAALRDISTYLVRGPKARL